MDKLGLNYNWDLSGGKTRQTHVVTDEKWKSNKQIHLKTAKLGGRIIFARTQ